MKTPATSLLSPSEDIGVHASIDLVRSTDGNGISRAGDLRSFGINQWRYDYNRDLGTKLGWYIEGPATRLNDNFLAPTDPEDVTVSNVEHTISFYGGGSVDLTGAHTETINGEDVESRTEVAFTPSAGTLTITPSGTIEYLQLEEGAHASSPIGGDGVRAADDLTISDLDEIEYNDTESTFIAEVEITRLDKELGIFDLRTDNANRISLVVRDNPQIELEIRNGGSLEARIERELTATGRYEIAVAWGDGQVVMFVNGTNEGSDSYNNLPSVSELLIGKYASTSSYLEGTILDFPYYSRRLDNSELSGAPTTALQPTLATNVGFSTNTTPVTADIDLGRPSTNFAISDPTISNASLQNLTNSGDNQNYTVEIVPNGDGLVTMGLPADSYTDINGNSNEAADGISFVYDGTAPVVSDGSIDVVNLTDTTADFDYAKATDTITNNSAIVYTLVRSLHDEDFPDDSDLSTLANIDANGTVVDTGTDVAQLSEDSATSGVEYRYNVTAKDEAGNRALYNQTIVEFIEPTVHSVTIDQSFSHKNETDGTVQLSATVEATNVDDESVSWSSSNEEIATVDSDGLVTFVATGEVTITATSNFDNEQKDTLKFTIYEYSPVSEEWSFTTA